MRASKSKTAAIAAIIESYADGVDKKVCRKAANDILRAIKPNLLVIIEGGNLYNVFADLPGVSVTTIDHDCGDTDEDVANRNDAIIEEIPAKWPHECHRH